MKYFHPKRYYRRTKKYFRDLFLYYIMPDKMYLKYQYKKVFGRKLDLKNPQTFNEKIQWLKLYDRNPAYHNMVDKYEAKKIVAQIIGEEYIIPTLGVWDKFDDIDFNLLPNQFVLKCTHDAASTVICKDKSSFDIEKAKRKITAAQKIDYYRYENRQWAYKGIKPRIIAEKFITDSDNDDKELTDYKFFCFNGNVHTVMVAKGRESGKPLFYFFDKKWNLLKYNISSLNLKDNLKIERPERLDLMFEIAEKISQSISFVRVDLYFSNKKIYFGEWTFYPDGGMDNNLLPEIDLLLGSLVTIDN